MFASKGFRVSALLATLIMAFSLVAVDTAEARRGGSFGSRGIRTERSIPSTQVSPKTTAPVQNTMTNGTTQRGPTAAAATPARPSLFGGMGGAILGGFLFSGLFGMLFGFGFGGFGGMLALLFQVLIIGLIISFFMRRRQQQPAMAGGPSSNQFRYEAPNAGQNYAGRPSGATRERSAASQRAGSRDEIGVTDADLSIFQQRLGELQDAYSREDYAALRKISTPEVMGYLAEELGANASKGLRNEVYDVRLLDGDIAEAWHEDGTEYVTVAMHYESRDITRNRSTGEIVAGDDRITKTTELWTFQRQNRGPWLVSAIQDA